MPLFSEHCFFVMMPDFEKSYSVDSVEEVGDSKLSPATLRSISTSEFKSYEKVIETRALLRRLYLLKKRIAAQIQNEEDIPRICVLIRQHDLISNKMEQLEENQDKLKWLMIDRLSFLGVGSSSTHLAAILAEIGYAVGQLSLFGAALTLSILYGAQRGNLMNIYIAWWLFLAGVALTGALSVASAGGDPANFVPTRKNWLKRAAACCVVLFAFFCVVAGLAVLSMAAVDFDVAEEMAAGNLISGGPRPSLNPHAQIIKVAGYCVIWFCAALFVLGLIGALRPRLRRSRAKKRTLRSKFFTSHDEMAKRHRAYSYDSE